MNVHTNKLVLDKLRCLHGSQALLGYKRLSDSHLHHDLVYIGVRFGPMPMPKGTRYSRCELRSAMQGGCKRQA